MIIETLNQSKPAVSPNALHVFRDITVPTITAMTVPKLLK